jgi:hypothetical protein
VACRSGCGPTHGAPKMTGAAWVERRTDDEIRTAEMVAFLGAILIMLGVIADRVWHASWTSMDVPNQPLPTKDGGVLHTIREGIGRWKE